MINENMCYLACLGWWYVTGLCIMPIDAKFAKSRSREIGVVMTKSYWNLSAAELISRCLSIFKTTGQLKIIFHGFQFSWGRVVTFSDQRSRGSNIIRKDMMPSARVRGQLTAPGHQQTLCWLQKHFVFKFLQIIHGIIELNKVDRSNTFWGVIIEFLYMENNIIFSILT